MKFLTHSSRAVRYLSNGANETKKLAKLLVKEVFHLKSGRGASVIALVGALGSGKTTFIQGFCKGAGIKKRITSPTFVITKNYKLKTKNFNKIYHIDCYRIQKPNELLKLDFKEIIANPQNIVLIEWAEKIKKILPKNTIWIKFKHGEKENERKIEIN